MYVENSLETFKIFHTQFQRGTTFGNTTHREDFHFYPTGYYRPDVSTRRRGLLINDVCHSIQLSCFAAVNYSYW